MAQNLFVAGGGRVTEITSNGTQRTFASGVNASAVAFNSAGDLFVTDIGSGPTYEGNGSIYEYTSNGVQSTFATGLTFPDGLAFNSAGDLFVADHQRRHL